MTIETKEGVEYFSPMVENYVSQCLLVFLRFNYKDTAQVQIAINIISALQDKEVIGIPVFSNTFSSIIVKVQNLESELEVDLNISN